MSEQLSPTSAYRAQLTWLARAMATAKYPAVYGALAPGSSPLIVEDFVQANCEKRIAKLKLQLDFLAEAFNHFDDLLGCYIAAVPLEAYDLGRTDAEHFLQWLERSHPLTPEQRDHVACQRARHTVKSEGGANRRGHLRFQELWNLAAQLANDLDTNPRLRLHLNPIRVWSRFTTPVLLDDETPLPADVLFFPVGNNISTAVLEPGAQALVNELAAHDPCTLDEWATVSQHGGREDLAAFCRDLAEMGLVAFS